MNLLDDIERAIDDGVNVVKSICKDQRVVPGGGAAEIEVAKRLAQVGDKATGLNQYSIKKFAESLEVVPRTLAENAGMDSTEVISSLYAAHQKEGGVTVGVNIEVGSTAFVSHRIVELIAASSLQPEQDEITRDMAATDIWDSLAVKVQAIKLATNAALTVLSVDQIIMSKPAGLVSSAPFFLPYLFTDVSDLQQRTQSSQGSNGRR
jgi:T-complex protein 1 subunit theta